MTGLELIAHERNRQIEVENFDSQHDDTHVAGELAMAAACYAAPRPLYELSDFADQGAMSFEDPWPFEPKWDKREWTPRGVTSNETIDKRRRVELLVKAGALIAAEIDRLQRGTPIYTPQETARS